MTSRECEAYLFFEIERARHYEAGNLRLNAFECLKYRVVVMERVKRALWKNQEKMVNTPANTLPAAEIDAEVEKVRVAKQRPNNTAATKS